MEKSQNQVKIKAQFSMEKITSINLNATVTKIMFNPYQKLWNMKHLTELFFDTPEYISCFWCYQGN